PSGVPSAAPSRGATVTRDASGARRSRRRRRSGVGELLTQRPRAVGAAAGAVVFVLAVLVGVAWFSPDSSSAETPRPGSDGTVSSSPTVAAP
ncbi:serine/threonine protein kinase, partial [Streptomyces sp. NPDC005534]